MPNTTAQVEASEQSTDALLDIPGLAKRLNMRESWVRERISARAIPHHRLGKHVRFAPADVAEILASTRVSTQTVPTRDDVTRRRSAA